MISELDMHKVELETSVFIDRDARVGLSLLAGTAQSGLLLES